MAMRTVIDSLEALEQRIENYVPRTRWDAANGLPLKWLKRKRKSLEYAVKKHEERQKNGRVAKLVDAAEHELIVP